MLDIKVDVNSLKKLEAHIKYVESLNNMKYDKDFQDFIKHKCWSTLENVMEHALNNYANTTNNDSISIYKQSNYIEDIDNGFVIYNNAKIPANVKGKQNDISNYQDGMFNLALAFEYGVGIIGIKTNDPKAWNYNVNNYNFGWHLPNDVAEKYGLPKGSEYAGYEGLEIYRATATIIMDDLEDWVLEYRKNKGGVSV